VNRLYKKPSICFGIQFQNLLQQKME